MTAGIYVSYFDPNGLGAITKNIKKFSKPVPVLLVIGTDDPFYPESKAMFDSAPANAASRYVVLNIDHLNMPNVVAAEFVKWLIPLRNEAVVKKSEAKTGTAKKLPVSGFVSRAEGTRDFSVVEIHEKRGRFVLKFGKL
jgi:hypothetical protein